MFRRCRNVLALFCLRFFGRETIESIAEFAGDALHGDRLCRLVRVCIWSVLAIGVVFGQQRKVASAGFGRVVLAKVEVFAAERDNCLTGYVTPICGYRTTGHE